MNRIKAGELSKQNNSKWKLSLEDLVGRKLGGVENLWVSHPKCGGI